MGNVYVRFREQERASNALKDLTGRFFPGQIFYALFSVFCIWQCLGVFGFFFFLYIFNLNVDDCRASDYCGFLPGDRLL